jgi:ribonuclease E
VIKGVLPDAPAPVALPKPTPAPIQAAKPQPKAEVAPPAVVEKGFFGWLKNLFSPAPVTAPVPVVQTVATTPTQEPHGSRDGRPARDSSRRGEPRGDRPEGNRNGRNGERGPRPEGRSDGRSDGRSGRNSDRGNRPERSERPTAVRERQELQASTLSAESASVNATTEISSTIGSPEAARSDSRPERSGRSRGERRPRGPKPGEETRLDEAGNLIPATSEATATPADDALGEVDQTNRPEAAPREKRSRDRYGRDRKPRSDRTERNDAELGQTAPAAEGTVAPQEEDAAPRKSYFTTPVVSVPSSIANAADGVVEPAAVPTVAVADSTERAAAEATMTTAATEPTPVELTAALAVPMPTSAAPAVAALQPAAKPGMPIVLAYSLPVDTLKLIAEQSGLAWVNSDTAKVVAAQVAIAAEPQPVHVPRERPAPIIMDDKPLVLVETKRDLRHLTLPFEEAEA